MKRLKFMLSTAALTVAFVASAVPAKRGVRTVTQPDGSTLQVELIGDEFNHCYLTIDQKVLIATDDAYYYAALDTEGKPVKSDVLASDPGVRTVFEKNFAATQPSEQLREKLVTRADSPRRRAIPQSGVGTFPGCAFPTKGNVKAVAVLVAYKDVAFSISNPNDYFTRMLNQQGFKDNKATGSARDYFIDASNGAFTPTFDVYGPVTLPNNRSYYGGNNLSGDDKAPEMMAVHALQALDATVDFSQYDQDHNGVIDNVYVFYAGLGEADSNVSSSVWPHSWDLSSATSTVYKFDGVRLDHYACSNELDPSNVPSGIGTFVHEFSHVMGLPDLYHTASTAYYTPDAWSIMDYGPYTNDGRTPPTYSAFERNAMGWIDPIVIDGAESVELEDILSSNKCYIIPTSKNTEFFLLENRQQHGWDKYLPGHGMLIWHIDYDSSKWSTNTVNNTRSHQNVDIVEANNNPDASKTSNLAGYPFPGSTGATEFTDDTKPAMKTWSGQALGLPITNIAEVGGIISFDVCGGKAKIETPVVNQPTNVTATGFVASWQPVQGATDYLLTVSTEIGGEEVTYTANMGTGSTVTLPNGWTKNVNTAYTSSDFCGEAIPSLKLGTQGAYLLTSVFSDPVTAIKFWYRGASASTINSLLVEGLVNDQWQTIHTEMPINNAVGGSTVEVQEIPAGVEQVRFVYDKAGVGNLALDDVVITAGSSSCAVLPGYDAMSTNGLTSMTVTVPNPEITTYKYSVVATNGNDMSKPSAEVHVTLSPAGVDNLTQAPAAVKVIGNTICIDASDTAVTVTDMLGRIMYAGQAPAQVTVPSALYIVSTGKTTQKVLVK